MTNVTMYEQTQKNFRKFNNSVMGEYCNISPFAKFGQNIIIGNRVTIGPGAVIDDGCRIYDGTCIALEPQHLDYYKENKEALFNNHLNKYVIIGKNTIIRENCTVHTPFKETVTQIGNDCFLMANTHVAHDCVLGNNVVIANNTALGGHCEVGDFANIGLNTCVHQYTHIGEYSMVGMGSIITKDVLPFHLVAGSRDDIKVSINVIGYRRNWKGDDILRELKAFRIDEYNIEHLAEYNSGLSERFKKFMERSKNGYYN